jgi:hypothetical protein
MSSVEFEHFRFPVDDGDPQERLDALMAGGWELAGPPRNGFDMAGRRVVVYRMRIFPQAVRRTADEAHAA